MRFLRIGSILVVAGCLTAGCGGGGDVVGGGPSQVTIAEVQAQVFTPRCALPGCHTGPAPAQDLDLAPGAAVAHVVGVASVESPGFLRVEPFDPADSYLYMKLAGDPRILGDRMPASGGPLSAGELSLVETWIRQGAN